MNTGCEYHYDSETKIMFKKHFGRITLESIIDSWNVAIGNVQIPLGVEGYLLDLTDAELCLNRGQEKILVEYFNERRVYFEATSLAVVVNTPREIIFPIIAESIPKIFALKTFSTKRAAVAWLLFQVHKNECCFLHLQ